MQRQIRFSVLVALACLLLAQGAQPRSSRIGPTEIYPDSNSLSVNRNSLTPANHGRRQG